MGRIEKKIKKEEQKILMNGIKNPKIFIQKLFKNYIKRYKMLIELSKYYYRGFVEMCLDIYIIINIY